MRRFVVNLLLSLIALLMPGIAARGEFKIYNATWNEPASTQPAVAIKDLPRGVEPCLWTGNRSDVWANPVTEEQVKHVAAIAKAGGTFNWRMDNNGLLDVPPGAFVMLDGETNSSVRSDAELRRMVDLYLDYYARAFGPASSPNFCLYAFRFGPEDARFEQSRDRDLDMVRAIEKRKTEIGDIVDKMPSLLLEFYIYEPVNEWLEARSFGVDMLRRLYPGKPIYALVRSDVPWKGPYSPGFQEKYVRRLRSSVDGVIVWGDRRANLGLFRAFAAAR